jgi:hypothetical protein
MTKDEALRLALEALERADKISGYPNNKKTITACEQALEQPEPEPVAWRELLREARDNCKASIVEEGISASRKEYRIDLEARLTAALNTSPPKREPLTDEQIQEVLGVKYLAEPFIEFVRAIEAAHGIGEKK